MSLKSCILSFAAILIATMQPYAFAAQPAEPLKARVGLLKTIRVKFDQTVSYTPPSQTEQAEAKNASKGDAQLPYGTRVGDFLRGEFRSTGEFTVLDSNFKIDIRSDLDKTEEKEGPRSAFPTQKTVAVTRDRYESLSIFGVSSRPLGGIFNRDQYVPDALLTIDLALGLRMYGSAEFLSPADLDRLACDTDEQGHFLAKYDDNRQQSHTWVYDRLNGYALLSYVVTDRDANTMTINCSDFVRRDDLVIPRKVVRKDSIRLPDKKYTVVETTTLEIRDIECPVPSLTEADLMIVWPASTTVAETRAKATLYPATSKVYTDQVIADEVEANDRAKRETETDIDQRRAK